MKYALDILNANHTLSPTHAQALQEKDSRASSKLPCYRLAPSDGSLLKIGSYYSLSTST